MPTWRQVGFALALAAIVIFAAELAYFQEFVLLSPWDDEGYFLLALRYLLDGQRLYQDVRVFYGPIYFLTKWLLHGPLGLPLTDDVVRLTAVAFRLATAAASAWLVFRLTRNATVALVALYFTTARQIFVALEPGHSQELVVLLTVMLPLAASIIEVRPLAVCALGVVVASLLLVKINVGLFAAVAVGTSLLAVATSLRVVAWLRTAALAAAFLLPWVLMRSHLEEWDVLAAITSGAVVALAPAVLLGAGSLGFHELGRFALGVVGPVLLALVAVVGRSSLASVVDCLVVYPQSLGRYFTAAPPRLGWTLLAAAGGVVGSLLWSLRPGGGGRGWFGQIAQAVRLLLGVYTLRTDATTLLALAPFAWLVLLPVSTDERPGTRQLPRLVLAWLAVLEPLQSFPLPGSQVVVGTQPMALVGLVCCGDGAAWLASLVPRGVRPRVRTGTAIVVLAAAIVLARGDAVLWRALWTQASPLALPGTSRLRAGESTAQTIRALVAHLRADCARFVVLPGSQSLYFWAQQPPPAPVLVPQDTRLMRDEDVTRLVGALGTVPAACLVRCATAARVQRDPRIDALYGRARLRRSFGSCTVFEYQPR